MLVSSMLFSKSNQKIKNWESQNIYNRGNILTDKFDFATLKFSMTYELVIIKPSFDLLDAYLYN